MDNIFHSLSFVFVYRDNDLQHLETSACWSFAVIFKICQAISQSSRNKSDFLEYQSLIMWVIAVNKAVLNHYHPGSKQLSNFLFRQHVLLCGSFRPHQLLPSFHPQYTSVHVSATLASLDEAVYGRGPGILWWTNCQTAFEQEVSALMFATLLQHLRVDKCHCRRLWQS